MYQTPIILLVGQAGSGKDTVAGFIVKNHNAVSIAQADPMKRLAKILFDFTDEQLWGPSDCRNAVDGRYPPHNPVGPWGYLQPWDMVWERFNHGAVEKWLGDLFPERAQPIEGPRTALRLWLNMVQTRTYWEGKPLTPRFVLQTLGTEWGRAQGRDLWSDYSIKAAFQLLGGGYRYERGVGLIPDDSMVGPDYVVISDGRFRNEIINVRRVGGSVVRIDSPSVDTSAIEIAGVKGHASEKEQKSLPRHFFTQFIMNDKTKGLSNCEKLVDGILKAIRESCFWIGYEGDLQP